MKSRPGKCRFSSWLCAAAIVAAASTSLAYAQAGPRWHSAPPSLQLAQASLPSLRSQLDQALQPRLEPGELRWRAPQAFLPSDGPELSAQGAALSFGRERIPEFCPHYWPELFPRDDLWQCTDVLLASPELVQARQVNPYALAADRVAALDSSRRDRWHTAVAAAAYVALVPEARPEDVTFLLFKQRHAIWREVAAAAADRWVVPRLPQKIFSVQVGEGQQAVELGIVSRASFDSAGSIQHILLSAARRGVKAVAIADRNTTFGWEEAELLAASLKRSGCLPLDFQVLPAQLVRTPANCVLVVGVRSRIPDGMTTRQVAAEAHRRGGLALLARPGLPGGARLLQRVGVDGFIVRPGFAEMYRAMELIDRSWQWGVAPLYAGFRVPAALAGLFYCAAPGGELTGERLRRALAEGEAYAASPAMLPWMTAIALKPIGPIQRTLNRYFRFGETIWSWLADRMGADFVQVWTTWDEAVWDSMGLVHLPAELYRIADGSSRLCRRPHVLSATIEVGPIAIKYTRRRREVVLTYVDIW